jgi:hypothetical protein
LWILAIGPNITVIHRIVQTWQQTKANNELSPAPVRASANHNGRTNTPHDTPILTRSARGGR